MNPRGPGEDSVHFSPVTHDGEFISRPGIDVIFNMATHHIVSVRAENNQGIPYTIRLSPGDQQFIQDSIAAYLSQQNAPQMSSLPGIPGMPQLPQLPGMPPLPGIPGMPALPRF